MEELKGLRLKRVEKKYTLQRLAKEVGITLQSLSNYERGVRTMPVDIALKTARILGCTVEDLV